MARTSGHRSIAAFVLIACCGLRGAAAAEAAVAPPPQQEAVDVDIEVYEAARIKELRGGKYPDSQRYQGYEGWVTLSFMVNPQGKAYEISVVDSLGGAPFEKNAIKAVENSIFEPAKLAGTAVDSGSQLKLRFAIQGQANGASALFASSYRKLGKKLEANDRQGADEVLALLKATNLYEDAYRNLGLYGYHLKWGTEEDQLADLRAAVAGEVTARYLEKNMFASVLSSLLKIQIKRQDYGEALATWRALEPIAPQTVADAWIPVMKQVLSLQASDVPVRLTAEITKKTSWFNRLFRRRFEVVVLSGRVSEIKLRCAKRLVFFRYQAQVQYTVSKREGQCGIEVVGDHGTKFELIQT